MMNKKIIILVSLLFSTSVFASSNNSAATTNIAELFPYAAQSHNENGEIEMEEDSAYIIGTNNGRVDFKKKDGSLKGKCDNVTCTLSYELGPSINLQWADQTPTLPFFKDYPSGANGSKLDCDSNNKNKTFNSNAYTSINVTQGCNIKPSENNVFIKDKVTVDSNSDLLLAPGNYWMNSLELESGSIKVLGNGTVNLYVKDKVELKQHTLGDKNNPINVYHYSKGDFKLGENLTWYGDLVTNKELKYQGSTNLHGTIHAKSLDLQGNAKLHLTPSEYWYQEIELQNSGEIMLTGSQLTRFHIKDELELEGNSKINAAGNPLLIFVYGDKKDDEGDVDLEGSAEIHGHLYAQGEVEMQGNTRIYGAVNTFDLEIEGSSAIIYREFLGGDSLLDHYQLHFNTNNDNVTAYACGDNTCNPSNLYAGEVKKLHIHANKSNFHNFDKFYGSSSITKKWNTSQCTTFTIQNADKNKNGANPWPASTPALQCFLDGTRVANCEVCPKPESVNSYSYVYGIATIDSDSIVGSGASEFTVKQGGGNGLANARNQQPINNGSKLTLPLEFTFDKAEQVNLVLSDNNGREYSVKLTFVPKKLAWDNSSTECVGENGEFNYKSHHKSCAVLGKAGENTTLAIKAYGKDDKLIEDYQVETDDLIAINELDDKKQKTDVSLALNSIKLENDKAEITYSISQVALIQAVIKEHCAPYAIDSQGECGLPTKGDSQILGRTVPAYLTVANQGSGIIENDAAYRGKEVVFTDNPYFEVMGCAKGQEKDKCSLPSYKGEFAQDLTQYASITLEDSAEHEEIVGAVNQFELEDKEGAHQLELVVDLIPPKKQPQAVTPIEDKLVLKIEGHDGLDELTGKVLIAEKKAQLRYGFLTIDNLELLIRTAGDMPLHLYYYGDTLKEIKEDIKTNLELTASKNNVYLQLADNSPTLELDSNDKKLTVKKHDTEWSGTVELTVEPWLQPYSEAQLKNPEANLIIIEQARKRGHNRVFNRREAVQ